MFSLNLVTISPVVLEKMKIKRVNRQTTDNRQAIRGKFSRSKASACEHLPTELYSFDVIFYSIGGQCGFRAALNSSLDLCAGEFTKQIWQFKMYTYNFGKLQDFRFGKAHVKAKKLYLMQMTTQINQINRVFI